MNVLLGVWKLYRNSLTLSFTRYAQSVDTSHPKPIDKVMINHPTYPAQLPFSILKGLKVYCAFTLLLVGCAITSAQQPTLLVPPDYVSVHGPETLNQIGVTSLRKLPLNPPLTGSGVAVSQVENVLPNNCGPGDEGCPPFQTSPAFVNREWQNFAWK